MRSPLLALALAVAVICPTATKLHAQNAPFLSEAETSALAQELSGEAAKRAVEAIAQHHRTRGSRPFRAAADWIAERARAYGLEDVRVEELPADGEIFYGTQRSRRPWDAEFAELWELRERDGQWVPAVRWASWEAVPLTLAQDSESGQARAELVDVGQGTAESEYAGKDVRGKLVLVSAQPGEAAELAVGRYGAAGIVSWAQNQRTAWWGEDESLIRWGHLETFSPVRTFAFMVSPATARSFQQRLGRGERIMMDAVVRAGQHAGVYSLATAAIIGADPALRDQEIVYSCHLDHPRPGANDNASGCATILEVGRTLAKLIAENRVARPARTLRFVWPAEIEGTIALLNARPEWAARVTAAVHMDMVGGGPDTKAIFHVTRGPESLPSFVYDVGHAFGEFVNRQSEAYASMGSAAYPLVAPEGGKEPLLASLADFSSGSDHQIYTEGSWRIPAIYLNDWPDRYIHTTGDTPARIDPTKLKRAAFIGAASGYVLARMSERDVPEVQSIVERMALRRVGSTIDRQSRVTRPEADNLARFRHAYEHEVARSIERFAARNDDQRARSERFLAALTGVLPASQAPALAAGDARLLLRRNALLKGPMSAFGYSYLGDKLGAEKAAALTLSRQAALWGDGDYTYEVLNLVDGTRRAREIRDAVSAIYGPVPLESVVEYLRALESIDVIQRGTMTSADQATSASDRPTQDSWLGRWDLTVRVSGEEYPMWLELTALSPPAGRLQGRTGHALPIAAIVEGNRLEFPLPSESAEPDTMIFTATLQDDRLQGEITSRRGQRMQVLGVRAPALDRPVPNRWGEPIDLLANGLDGWRPVPASERSRWRFENGILENTASGANLMTAQAFEDFKLHVEVNVPAGGNSGIYLRGRHEVQVQDDYGNEPHSRRMGGIYGQVTPTALPARRPGEWQVFDITFVGRRVTVVLNGVTIIDNQEIPGITGGALDSREGEPGPIMLQGDHTAVRYRNIVLTPAAR